jgi:SAM-dependent methyltransferase
MDFVPSILPHIKPRRNFIQKYIDCTNPNINILELGAFAVPTFYKSEANIMYMDRSSTEELLMSIVNDIDKKSRVVPVDYVVKEKNFSQHIPLKFSLVIANHVVEHIPDLINWFQNISAILKPNGLLFLSIPHKEYTFDKLRQLTSITEILRCYESNLDAPTLYHVFDHMYFRRPILAKDVWNNNYKDLLKKGDFDCAKDALEHVKTQFSIRPYVDAHCSVFTCQSFLDISYELKNSGYIDLDVFSYKDVEKPYNEFFVVLKKSSL